MSKRNDYRSMNRAERRRLTREKARARKANRTVAADYIPTGENHVFSFLTSIGLGQVAFTVAQREVNARDIDDASDYWFSLFDAVISGATSAMDSGELPEFEGASIMGGLHLTLKADYSDVEPIMMLRLHAVVTGMCLAEFSDLGYEVVKDAERFDVVRSATAA